ncbi:MAG: hypothetical protein A2020_13460 [Lentisphaerae bacterium GWF2_45_14]|nr:MAG: hypothetical protein A2020_13460 [Lentisphaerae bacterium GWF2_45_14]
MIHYREPLFRPPAEGDSLIFQAAYGCPHNGCRFCMMYKGVRYHERELDEILKDFREGARLYPETMRIFLADGDVMSFSFPKLKAMLEELNRLFPFLARVNTYANGSSILLKKEEELKELHRLKLNTLYVGLESGDEEVIRAVGKKESVGDMVDAVVKTQEIGFKCSVMILLGLAGKKGSPVHALKTAEALNNMQPRLLSALRFIEVPGTKMNEGYEAVTEHEAVSELKTIIEALELKKTVFRANHSSNPVPLSGRFPQDRDKLLAEVGWMLSSNMLDKKGPGRLPLFL